MRLLPADAVPLSIPDQHRRLLPWKFVLTAIHSTLVKRSGWTQLDALTDLRNWLKSLRKRQRFVQNARSELKNPEKRLKKLQHHLQSNRRTLQRSLLKRRRKSSKTRFRKRQCLKDLALLFLLHYPVGKRHTEESSQASLQKHV